MELREFAGISIYVPSAEAVAEMQQEAGEAFWARLWPSAQALAAFIKDNSKLLQDKKVLEMAGGLGLPSIAAAPYAREVICSDLFSGPMVFVEATARHHAFRNIFFSIIDWRYFPGDILPDMVLMSDVNYDPSAFPHLQDLFRSLLDKGVTILLATPQRIVARPFINSLLPDCVRNEERMADGQFINIYLFRKTIS
jgi:predicted nicotinamide N-methyase